MERNRSSIEDDESQSNGGIDRRGIRILRNNLCDLGGSLRRSLVGIYDVVNMMWYRYDTAPVAYRYSTGKEHVESNTPITYSSTYR